MRTGILAIPVMRTGRTAVTLPSVRPSTLPSNLSRLDLPHTATSTRKSDNDTTALEIVHFLYALAYRTLIILTEFFPRLRDLLALLRKVHRYRSPNS